MKTTAEGLASWRRLFEPGGIDGISELLASDVAFASPVVHRPIEGAAMTELYLRAAAHVLVNDSFHYVREVVQGPHAVLEFETNVEGITINGVDMLTFDDRGRLIDFKVMVRPRKAMEKLHEKMAEMLNQLGG